MERGEGRVGTYTSAALRSKSKNYLAGDSRNYKWGRLSVTLGLARIEFFIHCIFQVERRLL
jgi:hypothetical protein